MLGVKLCNVVCELGSEESVMQNFKGEKFDAFEIQFPLLGQLRPPAAASATDTLGKPQHHAEGKAVLFTRM